MLSELKHSDGPVLLHLITNKGNGLYEAERDPEKYHGVEGSHDNIRKFSAVVSSKLREMAARDDKVVAVSAAMLSGTGLSEMHAEYPGRCFDVGIAEEHAVAMCAGMAAAGLKPYFAVYSTFLQRGYDQLIHDAPGRFRSFLPRNDTQHDDNGADGRQRAGGHARMVAHF